MIPQFFDKIGKDAADFLSPSTYDVKPSVEVVNNAESTKYTTKAMLLPQQLVGSLKVERELPGSAGKLTVEADTTGTVLKKTYNNAKLLEQYGVEFGASLSLPKAPAASAEVLYTRPSLAAKLTSTYNAGDATKTGKSLECTANGSVVFQSGDFAVGAAGSFCHTPDEDQVSDYNFVAQYNPGKNFECVAKTSNKFDTLSIFFSSWAAANTKVVFGATHSLREDLRTFKFGGQFTCPRHAGRTWKGFVSTTGLCHFLFQEKLSDVAKVELGGNFNLASALGKGPMEKTFGARLILGEF